MLSLETKHLGWSGVSKNSMQLMAFFEGSNIRLRISEVKRECLTTRVSQSCLLLAQLNVSIFLFEPMQLYFKYIRGFNFYSFLLL